MAILIVKKGFFDCKNYGGIIMAMERPYVNSLSGDTLPIFGSVQQYFQDADNKTISLPHIGDCLRQGFRQEDVDLIKAFYQELLEKTNSSELRIICAAGETPTVRFAKSSSERNYVDVPMQYLDDPSVLVGEITIKTIISELSYQGRDLQQHIEQLSKGLKGAGIESTINLVDGGALTKLCSLRLTAPQYEDGGFGRTARNAYEKLTEPDYSRLDELLNAVDLVQGAFQEIIEVQNKTVIRINMAQSISAALICERRKSPGEKVLKNNKV